MRCFRVLALAVLLGLSLPGFAQVKSSKVEVGKPAPDFKLQATQIDKVFPGAEGKKIIALHEFQRGNAKNVVLFFFPKAMTRG